MYCMNCGANNNEDAAFCIQCGKQLGTFVPQNEKQKKKSKGLFVVLISAVLICAIVIASVFDLWPWSRGTNDTAKTNPYDRVQNTGQVAAEQGAENGVVTFENFYLSEIVAQCPDCQPAIDTYIELLQASQDWRTSKEELEALAELKCEQMQHFCTAEAIYVEDIPYSFRGSFGLYTGDWIGAGPAGKGSYFGTVYDENVVSYTGEWGFGMPNGAGELYVERWFGNWDMTYRGYVKNGKRDGPGSLSDYSDGGGYREPLFRIFDEAVYVQDQLTEWIDCVEYNANTGDIMQYCKMKMDETGAPVMGEVWGANDLSPEQMEALGIATVVISFGLMAYLVYGAVTREDNYDEHAAIERQMDFLEEDRIKRENQKKEEEEHRRKLREQRVAAGKELDQIENLKNANLPYDAARESQLRKMIPSQLDFDKW